MPRKTRRAGVVVGSADMQALPVRPPAIPGAAKHARNLQECGITASTLAEWLGVSAEDITDGKTAAIRAAVAFYCEWRGRVLLARASRI